MQLHQVTVNLPVRFSEKTGNYTGTVKSVDQGKVVVGDILPVIPTQPTVSLTPDRLTDASPPKPVAPAPEHRGLKDDQVKPDIRVRFNHFGSVHTGTVLTVTPESKQATIGDIQPAILNKQPTITKLFSEIAPHAADQEAETLTGPLVGGRWKRSKPQ